MNINKLKKFETYKLTLGIVLVGISSGVISHLCQKLVLKMSTWTILGSVDSPLSLFISMSFVLISFFLTKLYFSDTGGSGIPHVKLSLVALRGKMARRMPAGKILTSLFSLSSGLVLGKEGPLVTISASMAHLYSVLLNLSRESTKLLVIAGASSGLSGAFNTPIAAVVFTVEEILGELNSKYMGAIIVASVLASTVSFNILGTQSIFPALEYIHENEWHLIFYALLGITMSVIGEIWKTEVLFLKKLKSRFSVKTEWIYIIITILIVWGSSFINKDFLGDGHSLIKNIFMDPNIGSWTILLTLLFGKFILSALSYSTGLSGGLFMPILCMGALGGSLFANLLIAVGVEGVQVGAFSLLGMTSMLVATIRVPFTAFVMLFELTRDYDMILPLMVSSAASYLFSQIMDEESIYEAVSEYEGAHLPTQKDRELLNDMEVMDCMVEEVKTIPIETQISDIVDEVKESDISGYPITENGYLAGIISKAEILSATEFQGIREVCKKDIISIHPDQSLLVAIEKFQRFKVGRLPVTSRFNKRQIVGIITMEDIMKYFRDFH